MEKKRMMMMTGVGSFSRLRSGHEIPKIGFGTWQLKGEVVERAVFDALVCGYRHIDTASGYQNEEHVQKGISRFLSHSSSNASSNVSVFSAHCKNRIFITSKVSPGDMKGFEGTYASAVRSLENLQIPSLDLLLLHWPGSSSCSDSSSSCSSSTSAIRENRLNCWKALEKLYVEGKVKSIGVSNFLLPHLQDLLDDGVEETPMVNQIEIHPLCPPSPHLLKFTQKHNIILEAYSPLGIGNSRLLQNPELVSIASNLKKTVAQILLRWSLQKNFVVLPRSQNENRIRENLQIFDFEISDADMQIIDALSSKNEETHFCWDPRTVV